MSSRFSNPSPDFRALSGWAMLGLLLAWESSSGTPSAFLARVDPDWKATWAPWFWSGLVAVGALAGWLAVAKLNSAKIASAVLMYAILLAPWYGVLYGRYAETHRVLSWDGTPLVPGWFLPSRGRLSLEVFTLANLGWIVGQTARIRAFGGISLLVAGSWLLFYLAF